MPHTEFLSDGVWARISADADASTNRSAAVAYVTSASVVPFRGGDTLVVDASDQAVITGQTSAELLQDLYSRGVHLYSLKSLHAKVYAFDGVVVVGSCNMSESSRTRLREAAIRTDDHYAVRAVRNFLQELQQGADPIDQTFISRIRNLPVDSREPAEETSSGHPARALWRLRKPPPAPSANMRAYFVALIRAQMEELREDRPFYLWKGHFGHKDRMRKALDGRYVLLRKGVRDFSQGKGAPRADLLERFLVAVTTGNSGALPPDLEDRTLVPLLPPARE